MLPALFRPSPLPALKFRPGFPEITQVKGEPVYIIQITYGNSEQAGILEIEFRNKLETTKDISWKIFEMWLVNQFSCAIEGRHKIAKV